MRTRRIWTVIGVAVLLALSAACGGDDGDDGDGAAGSEGTPAETTDAGSDDSADTTTDDGGGLGFDCPLSAQQVGEVLGASVEKDEATCSYSPGGNAGSVPAAGFLAQPFCDEEFSNVLGFTDSFDGLGVDAYVRTDGAATAELLVCADDPFVVVVDSGSLSDTEAATGVSWAEALARAALEAG